MRLDFLLLDFLLLDVLLLDVLLLDVLLLDIFLLDVLLLDFLCPPPLGVCGEGGCDCSRWVDRGGVGARAGVRVFRLVSFSISLLSSSIICSCNLLRISLSRLSRLISCLHALRDSSLF